MPSVLTSVPRAQVVDLPRPGVEDEDDVHAQTIAVELQTLLWIFDTHHEMIETVPGSCRRARAGWRGNVSARLIWPLWKVGVIGCHGCGNRCRSLEQYNEAKGSFIYFLR